jgi:hypothetical protein
MAERTILEDCIDEFKNASDMLLLLVSENDPTKRNEKLSLIINDLQRIRDRSIYANINTNNSFLEDIMPHVRNELRIMVDDGISRKFIKEETVDSRHIFINVSNEYRTIVVIPEHYRGYIYIVGLFRFNHKFTIYVKANTVVKLDHNPLKYHYLWAARVSGEGLQYRRDILFGNECELLFPYMGRTEINDLWSRDFGNMINEMIAADPTIDTQQILFGPISIKLTMENNDITNITLIKTQSRIIELIGSKRLEKRYEHSPDNEIIYRYSILDRDIDIIFTNGHTVYKDPELIWCNTVGSKGIHILGSYSYEVYCHPTYWECIRRSIKTKELSHRSSGRR